jgi:hypothetical protein
MHVTYTISPFFHSHCSLLSPSQIKPCHHYITTWQNHSNYCFPRTHLFRDRQFWIPMKHSKHSTALNLPYDQLMVMSLPLDSLPLLHHWILPAVHRSPHFVRCSANQCWSAKAPEYWQLCSINTWNLTLLESFQVAKKRITAMYRFSVLQLTKSLTQKKVQYTELFFCRMADGCTMFRVPIMSRTNPVHTSTWSA